MPIVELYSKRKRRAEHVGEPDVYRYDELPDRLRTQIRQIFTSAIGSYHKFSGYEMDDVPSNNNAWRTLSGIMRREMGVDALAPAATPYAEIMSFIQTAEIDDALSIVELCARYVEHVMPKAEHELKQLGATQTSSDALDELNYRFRDSGVGFEYASGEIIRIDSKFIHAEVVRTALSVLSDPRFRGAEEEFLEAHGHYRDGNAEEAITSANRAFESTMKCVCSLRGWQFEEKARASDLLKVLKANQLFPRYLDASFDQLLATLASGLPQIRNNAGGHGQGAIPRATPSYVVAYALHLAAANIVFLADAALGNDAE